jgi:HYR domain
LHGERRQSDQFTNAAAMQGLALPGSDAFAITGEFSQDEVTVSLPFGASRVGLGILDRQLARDAELQMLTVVDTTPPTVTAPRDVDVECTAPSGTPVVLGTATATDLCDATLTVSNAAPAAFSLGTTMVMWTSTDGG